MMLRTYLAKSILITTSLLPGAGLSGQEVQPLKQTVTVPMEVPAGTPLRVYLTRRAWYRSGQVVHAKTVEPVWAFDRVVIPAGAVLDGNIVELKPVSKYIRAMSIVRGDFTPLKKAQVAFTSIRLPEEKSLSFETLPSLGLASIYVPPRPGKQGKIQTAAKNSNGKSSQIRAFLKQQAQTQANSRSRGFLDFVRGPNKREWLENYLWSRLPYHPEWYRSGTRFDAVLAHSLDFGQADIPASTIQDMGSASFPDKPVMVRFLSDLDSMDAKVGDPIEGVLSEPLASADHKLALPEGTRLMGKVTLARPAKMFHRGGQLRFMFNKIELPESVASSGPRIEPVQAQVTGAESRTGSVAVDAEGTVKSTESKTRFIRPVIAGLIAAKSMDNDEGRSASGGGASGNYSGRSLGGFSGFGLLGTAATFGPRPLSSALGFYGLAWSVYSTVISRGREVTFQKNDAVSIRFAPPPAKR